MTAAMAAQIAAMAAIVTQITASLPRLVRVDDWPTDNGGNSGAANRIIVSARRESDQGPTSREAALSSQARRARHITMIAAAPRDGNGAPGWTRMESAEM